MTMKLPVFMLPITIDSSNDGFHCNSVHIAITQATYDSLVELVTEIETKLQAALDNTFHCHISDTGYVYFYHSDGTVTLTADGDTLLDLLGFVTLSTATTVTAENRCAYTYYSPEPEQVNSTGWIPGRWIHQAHNGVNFAIKSHNTIVYNKTIYLYAIPQTSLDEFLAFWVNYSDGMRYYEQRSDVSTADYDFALMLKPDAPVYEKQDPAAANHYILTLEIVKVTEP